MCVKHTSRNVTHISQVEDFQLRQTIEGACLDVFEYGRILAVGEDRKLLEIGRMLEPVGAHCRELVGAHVERLKELSIGSIYFKHFTKTNAPLHKSAQERMRKL